MTRVLRLTGLALSNIGEQGKQVKSTYTGCYGAMIQRVGANPELPGWDPSEDPIDAPLPEDLPEHPDFENDPLREQGWVSGEAMIEIIALDLSVQRSEASCPRCGTWVFTYGRLQFCSHGCPENLFVREASS